MVPETADADECKSTLSATTTTVPSSVDTEPCAETSTESSAETSAETEYETTPNPSSSTELTTTTSTGTKIPVCTTKSSDSVSDNVHVNVNLNVPVSPLISFQTMAALEMTEDLLRRIRIAQLLRDLYALALTSSSSSLSSSSLSPDPPAPFPPPKTMIQSPPKQEKRQRRTGISTMRRMFTNFRPKWATTTARAPPKRALHSQHNPETLPATATTTNPSSCSNNNNSKINQYTDEELLSRFKFRHELLNSNNSNHSHHNNDLHQGNHSTNHPSYLTPELAHRMIHAMMDSRKSMILGRKPLLSLLQSACEVLKRDDTLIRLSFPTRTHTTTSSTQNNSYDNKKHDTRVVVVGDLHGSLASLQHVLELMGDIGCTTPSCHPKTDTATTTVIFNGDFVDRGDESVQVICILLLLKLAYPHHVFLLRGNHEDVLVSSVYGFRDEVIQKYGIEYAHSIWEAVSALFGALPIAVVVPDTAVILHGGLPSAHFTLQDLDRIPATERCQIRTMMNAQTAVGQLLQGILWSDPSLDGKQNGIHPNTMRSIGVFYGPDVVTSFLKKHGLKYLIRAHEVADDGVDVWKCEHYNHEDDAVNDHDDGCHVITVFSQSEYPNGEGTNLGAFLILYVRDNTDYEFIQFSHNTKFNAQHRKRMKNIKNIQDTNTNTNDNNNKDEDDYIVEINHYIACTQLNYDDPYVHTLKTLISSHTNTLSKAFSHVAPCGTATLRQWADIMACILALPQLPWMALLTSLVPEMNDTTELRSGTIDWRAFLALYDDTCCVANNNVVYQNDGDNGSQNIEDASSCQESTKDIRMEIIHANHHMLMTVYKFLDFNGNGTIDREEVLDGIKMLNKRLPDDRQVKDAYGLFDTMDADGNGEIHYKEFEQMFKLM